MRWWDESMFAVNAYEMMQTGEPFSLSFNGAADIYNQKPPMTVWLQVFFVKLFGYNEMAVRLPSAFAVALTLIFLFYFIQKEFNVFFAWCAALVLLTADGFIGFHTGRTGESDALLTLFTFLANLSFLRYVKNGGSKYILLFFFWMTFAFLTKAVSALMFAPALLVILLIKKKTGSFFTSAFTWLGLGIFVSVSVLALYLREKNSPGYFSELMSMGAGRFFKVVDGHRHPFEFYFDNLITERFSFWSILALIGALFFGVNRTKEQDQVIGHVLLLVISYLLVISLSVTKLFWYDMPAYPYLAIVSAYAIWKLTENSFSILPMRRSTILLLTVVFAYPYWLMFRKSQANSIPEGEKQLEAKERFLYLKSTEGGNLNGLKIYYADWTGSLLFYKYKFREMGQDIRITPEPVFNAGDKVLLSDDSLFRVVSEKCKFTLLEEYNKARLIQIKEIQL
jgi:4-amino-4-deoxy-L-arabinose transferase-like glycosyltransferase